MSFVRTITLVTTGLAWLASLSVNAQTYLTTEHVDFRIAYDSATGRLTNIVARNEDFPPQNYESNQVVLVVPEWAEFSIPPGFPQFGNEGDPLWVLPQSQDPQLLYLGVSAEGLPPGVFSGSMGFQLLSVETLRTNAARGHFFAWQADGVGNLLIKMNTRDGITAADNTQPLVSSHEHFNWGFTTTGVYRVTFQASGQRVGESTNLFSPPTTFIFHVLPLSPFESWQTNHWSATERVEIIAPGADPDGDGTANFLEYTFATDPTHAGATNLPVYFLTNIAGTTYGALTFTRNKAATDVTLTPEASWHLAGPWQPMTNVLGVTDLGATERITVRDTVSIAAATNRYAHLKVMLQ